LKVVNLPSKLTGDFDLAGTNRQLQAGEALLNWNAVEEAAPEVLETLLVGLDLVRDSDIINIESIPDKLGLTVLKILSKPARPSRPETPRPEIQGNAPEVWQPSKVKTGELKAPDTAPKPLLEVPSQAFLRAELERLAFLELHGPVNGPKEELTEPVRDRYLVGMLAPGKLQDKPEKDEHFDIDEQEEISSAEGSRVGEDGASDPVSQQLISLCPSSFGFSFSVAQEATQFKVQARWGHYQRQHSETLTTDKGTARLVWQRTQRQGEKVFNLKEGPIAVWRPEPQEQPEVVVRGLIRRSEDKFSGEWSWSVTLFLVNNQNEPEKNRDSAWLFQPELVAESLDGDGIFQQRQPQRPGRLSPDLEEEQAMRMLYRNQVGFAIGHGVGVHADPVKDAPIKAWRISTRVVPAYEIPSTEHFTVADTPATTGLVLKMLELAQTPVDELRGKLSPLTTAYEGWIKALEARINNPLERLGLYKKYAQQAIKNCRHTLGRIQEGIELILGNEQALRAFRFMNEAMHRQFVQTRVSEQQRQGKKLTPDKVEPPAWRPFQLAFILLNLPSLTDLHHPDRGEGPEAIADLLWFPTGGGKTEAYLGLTAYTLGIRRLQGSVNGRIGEEGVAVIMRYTLRLLTLQQFQRASALMCACEMLRREALAAGDNSYKSTPFRLGLWVGQRTTPNTTEQSHNALSYDSGRGSAIGGIGTPRQLTNCPWCGNEIKASVDKGRGRTLMYCADPMGSCPFTEKKSPGEGLPVLVVDEEIYRLLPALLIATVDKFAQMPWKGETEMLFGQVNRKCERHGFCCPEMTKEPDRHPATAALPAARVLAHAPLRPPDLIIQDELHLISGPLGTLVGLYETAVDSLCSWEVEGKTVRPKVIAATATIRRAERQMKALFLRQVNIFPPSGLDIGDNFFARQITPSVEKPGRKYIGICASGRRLKAALIRVYVAYLSAGQFLFEKYGVYADPWMTLVGYFNSLNELGGTRRLVEDDVRSRLSQMDKRGLAVRKLSNLDELTSRRSSIDIPKLLDQLEKPFDRVSSAEANDKKPLDVLLATNMISVGVDVKRLGLMVVTSQPKNTAEYIQATSRVGRIHPGLVCVVYNWARPRDLSHYEQFEHYHATYYQYVEALSVTPFAARAIDRGLSALMVSYIRLAGADYNQNTKAGDFQLSNPYFKLAISKISERAELVKDKEAANQIKLRLQTLGASWVKETEVKGRQLGYKDASGTVIGLLSQAGSGEWKDFTCLNSLRDVEPTVKLLIDERSLGEKKAAATVGVEQETTVPETNVEGSIEIGQGVTE